MKKELIITAIILLLNIILVSGAELRLSPELITTKTGDTFEINIILENNQNIYGLDLSIENLTNINLVSYEFTDRTNNSMKTLTQTTDKIRIGVLYSKNETGITQGNESIIKLILNASEIYQNIIIPVKTYLSDENGTSIQTTTKGSNVTIIKPTAYLSCTDNYGEDGDIVTTTIKIHPNNTEIGGIDFKQNYDTKVSYTTASKTTETNNAILSTNPESGKIRIVLAGTNITQTTNIATINYEITSTTAGKTNLSFEDISISETNGKLIFIEQSQNCEIDIDAKSTTPPSTGGSTGGGGGGSGSSNQPSQEQPTELKNPSSSFDAYASLLGKQNNQDNQEENIQKQEITEKTYIQKEDKNMEETSEKIQEEQTTEKTTKRRSVPLAIISLTALAGLGIVFVYEIRNKNIK